jgi:hypothetical protein
MGIGVATTEKEEAEEGRRLEGPREERHLLGCPHVVRCYNTLATADFTNPSELTD